MGYQSRSTDRLASGMLPTRERSRSRRYEATSEETNLSCTRNPGFGALQTLYRRIALTSRPKRASTPSGGWAIATNCFRQIVDWFSRVLEVLR